MRLKLRNQLGWRAVTASAVVLGMAGGPAFAQTAPATTDATTPAPEPAGWTKVCDTDPATNAEVCSVLFQIVADGGQFIAQAALRQQTGQDQIMLSVFVRTNVYIQPGIRVQIDATDPAATLPYVVCDPNVCIGEAQVDAAFVNSLKRGNQLTISTFIPASDQPNGYRQADFPMTLSGFTSAYDGPGLNSAGAQARQDELNQTLQDRAEAARQRLIEQQQQQTTTPPPAAP